jgi:hypothetical protein
MGNEVFNCGEACSAQGLSAEHRKPAANSGSVETHQLRRRCKLIPNLRSTRHTSSSLMSPSALAKRSDWVRGARASRSNSRRPSADNTI